MKADLRRAAWLPPLLLTAMGVAYKLGWLALKAVPFNGDEAIVALMARHILRGERPTFFYGQAYLGATDAWLVALSFSIFGESVLAIRLVQIALFAAFLITSYLVARRMGLTAWGARAALLWLALPPTMLTLYTTATLGGYGETLVLGNIAILLADSVRHDAGSKLHHWLILGGVAGFGLYTFPLILIYLVPIALGLLWRSRLAAWRGYLLAALGFVIGSAPWWWALIQSGGRELAELAGAGVADTLPGATYLDTVGVRLLNFFVFGVLAWWGLRYPWSGAFVLPVIGVAVLAGYVGALIYAARQAKQPEQSETAAKAARFTLWGMMAVLLITFLVTPFGGDPSGRYFLPLYLPLSIAIAMVLQAICNVKRTFGTLLLAGMIGYNVAGTALAAAVQPPGITTQFDQVTWLDHKHDQALIDFLLAQGETRGYTNYWVQTPIAFLSQERIILTAALPYHLDLGYTPRDDRYPPYTQAVAQADRAFYITTNHPPLDALLRAGLNRLGVSFKEQSIGNYQIFYGLSRKVTPDELKVYDKMTR
ncbi:MAG: glycosyltransferase family 39 protein [Chloroflexi bacterium]|nr:glycosyltransferase family 39 protein [Chloroflexota bacterium]